MKKMVLGLLFSCFVLGACSTNEATTSSSNLVSSTDTFDKIFSEASNAVIEESISKDYDSSRQKTLDKIKPQYSEESTTTESSQSQSTLTTETSSSSYSAAVSSESKNALQKANDYLAYTSFSKLGLYDQLIYEKYTPEAANYAIEHVTADWNGNALQKAKGYLDYSSFSRQGLYDQLIYEKYTETEAQYAIDNLPK